MRDFIEHDFWIARETCSDSHIRQGLHLSVYIRVLGSPAKAIHFCPLLLPFNVLQAEPLSHYLKHLCILIHQEASLSLFCPLSVLLARLLSAPFRNVDKALFAAD